MYKTFIRDQVVDGISDWVWRENENGAWDGPHREWENSHKDGYLKYCRNFDVVIQAGGNQGLYPRLFSKYFKTVYTFEPDSYNFHCLVNNCQQDNIFKIQAALGPESKLISISGEPGMTNSGTITVQHQFGLVPQVTIDSFNFTAVDLIQLDIEGYEAESLKGALQTIEKFRPVVSCERNDGNLLIERGYKHVTSVGADQIYVPGEFLNENV